MYIPKHFAMRDEDVDALLAHLGAADLVTATADGLFATYLPLHFEPDPEGATPGRLQGHLARNNPQWRAVPSGEAMVIAHGPDSYISPGFYPSKQEHRRVVPTWNYVTAHIYGRLVIHEEPDWLEANVRNLTQRHESTEAEPWSVDDAPEPFVAGQLRAIVGVELIISRVEAKSKLSQNRPEADTAGVVAGLTDRGDRAGAAAVERANPPG